VPAIYLVAAATEEESSDFGALAVALIIITLLIILNGLYVLAEFAIIGVRSTQMEQMANEGSRVARSVLGILRSNDKQNQYIATAQLGITIASLGLGMYGEPQIAQFIEPYLAQLLGLDVHDTLIVTVGSLLAIGLLTYLHVVIGEMVPKSIALSAPDRAVLAIFQPMRVSQIFLAIPVHVLNGIGDALLKLLRISPAEAEARLHSPEELELIVSESVAGGLLDKDEKEIIRKVFDFGERQVNQVMTPRPKVQAIALDTPLPALLEQVAASQHSRFPVFDGDLDNILGVLHIKDLVRLKARSRENFDIRLVLRSIPVVPEHYPVVQLLAVFKRRRIHIAVVLDEYGGTAGIVSLEDLVEEIMGEVRDEFDLESEPLVQVSPGVLDVAGHYLLDELQEYIYLGQDDELPNVETVSGLIMTILGRVPQVGDKFTIRDKVHFTVLAVDGLTVARARIEYPVSTENTVDSNQ
jgi:CBS domain containing-hemolysin-like protein